MLSDIILYHIPIFIRLVTQSPQMIIREWGKEQTDGDGP